MNRDSLPTIIQGGMGAGVSTWLLARAVSKAGQFGVVSGTALDLILVEGFKQERFPKIELRRAKLRRPQLFPEDEMIIAIATDHPDDVDTPLPVLDLNRPEAIADFIVDSVLKHDQNAASG